jgi:hypothetical protein
MLATIMAVGLALQSDELADAVKKTAALENYTFKCETKTGGKKTQPAPVEGHYQKDQPTALKSGAAEGFRKAGLIVYKEGDDWKKLEKPAKGEKKQQTGAAAFSGFKIPHEEIEGFEKCFEKVQKAPEKDKDCVLWSGDLTPGSARGLVSTGSKAEAKSQSTYTGTAKVWINDKGLVVRVEITCHVKGENKKGPFESDITRTLEISESGAAVEVPEGAKKALEGQP